MKVIEYIAPNKAAKQLGIAPATLRKYANMIEKLDSDKEYFMRDENDRRLYSKEDVTLIKHILELKKSDSITLESAMVKALDKTTKTDETSSETTEYSALPSDPSALYDIISKQQDQLDQYKELAERLAQNNIQLSNDLENAIGELKQANTELIEYKEDQQVPEKKAGFFSRLFNK